MVNVNKFAFFTVNVELLWVCKFAIDKREAGADLLFALPPKLLICQKQFEHFFRQQDLWYPPSSSAKNNFKKICHPPIWRRKKQFEHFFRQQDLWYLMSFYNIILQYKNARMQIQYLV